MVRARVPRSSIGRLMASVAAVALVLATGRETLKALIGEVPSELGVAGLAVLTTVFSGLPVDLILLAAPGCCSGSCPG